MTDISRHMIPAFARYNMVNITQQRPSGTTIWFSLKKSFKNKQLMFMDSKCFELAQQFLCWPPLQCFLENMHQHWIFDSHFRGLTRLKEHPEEDFIISSGDRTSKFGIRSRWHSELAPKPNFSDLTSMHQTPWLHVTVGGRRYRCDLSSPELVCWLH